MSATNTLGGAPPDHDFDGFWKELLDEFLIDFVALFTPDLNEFFDFSQPVQSLDKELHELFPADRKGRRFVDKLFRVMLRSGQPAALLFHIDVQEVCDDAFPRRMFQYRYRLFDRHALPLYSLAVLGDRDPSWRPDRFRQSFLDDVLEFRFRVVKLIDWVPRILELERSANPVAILVATYLRTKSTRPDRVRLEFKIAYAVRAANLGCDRERAKRLLRLIDWLMRLPEPLKLEFRRTMKELSEVKKMPILMDLEIEAMAIGEVRGEAQGALRGRQAAIIAVLQARFGKVAAAIETEIRSITDVSHLDSLAGHAGLAASVEQFQRQLSAPT